MPAIGVFIASGVPGAIAHATIGALAVLLLIKLVKR
jgi:hypothetical protein|tara:strand:- start:240 stop:347 length:108 start_codon:yes stop_codon:yes gene_type:complete